MTNGTTTVVRFALEKTTKGAVRYKEVDADGNTLTSNNGAVIGTLYVRKTALDEKVPQRLEVSIVSK